METRTLSPRSLAQALDVSESSIKRWADEGRLAVARTAGGHRRIELGEALRFVRETGLAVPRPERLGLRDALRGLGHAERCQAAPALFEALRDGEAATARGLLQAMYLAGLTVGQIVDGPLRDAMAKMGELWRHDGRGVFLEHRATEIALDAVRTLRSLLASPRGGAGVALGGAPAGDPYQLPSLAVATTLHGQGWVAHNLGAGTPASAFAAALAELRPRLVWLSVSVTPEAAVGAELEELIAGDAGSERLWVVGGRAAGGPAWPRHPGVLRCERLVELEAWARGLAAGRAAAYARPGEASPHRRSA